MSISLSKVYIFVIFYKIDILNPKQNFLKCQHINVAIVALPCCFNWRQNQRQYAKKVAHVSNLLAKKIKTSTLISQNGCFLVERETRFELATFALARQRSTTEPLPHQLNYSVSIHYILCIVNNFLLIFYFFKKNF